MSRQGGLRPIRAGAFVLLFAGTGCDATGPGDVLDLEAAPFVRAEASWADVGKACPADAAARSLSAAARDSLRAPARPYHDSRLAEVASRVPGGWGGTFHEDGRTTMYLVDPTKKDEATTALLAEGVMSGSLVRKGRWDFNQMYDWYRYLTPRTGPGISFTDIQESRNRIEFGVVDQEAWARVERLLGALDIPCYLVALKIQGYATID